MSPESQRSPEQAPSAPAPTASQVGDAAREAARKRRRHGADGGVLTSHSPGVVVAGCALVAAGLVSAALGIASIVVDPGSLAGESASVTGASGSAGPDGERGSFVGPDSEPGSRSEIGRPGGSGPSVRPDEPEASGAVAGSNPGSTDGADGVATGPDGQAGMTYVIQPGDTLARVSGSTGVPLDVLVAYNQIPDADLIHAGAVLVLSPRG